MTLRMHLSARRLVSTAAVCFASALVVGQQGPPGGGRRGGGPGGGVPVTGLTPADRQAFDEGNRTFGKQYSMAEGLGPVFNEESCAECHRNGGGTNRTVTRFGRVDEAGRFDALPELGGSLVQSQGIGSVTTQDGTHVFRGERTPPEATVRAQRRSLSLKGLGFVDAVPDEAWLALAAAERAADPATAGRAHLVFDAATGVTRVGKFGWKAQVPSLLGFAGDALLNEIGITSPRFRDEVCPQGDCLALGFNPAPALNDDGHDASALNDFMTMLAPPPAPAAGDLADAGGRLFTDLGCASCHRVELQAGPSRFTALNRAAFRPYSDFLLHDMGSLGDGIAQGQATPNEIRTAPLWGLGDAGRLLHDASAGTIDEAIGRHDGQALATRDRYNGLDQARRELLLAFLRSL